MGLKEAIAAGYIGADKLVTPSYKGGSNNGVMYTAEYVLLLNRLGLLTDADKQYWKDAMAPCEIEPGLIRRSAGSGDQEGPDDTLGYLVASKAIDPSKALAWLRYGLRHFGFYNNEQPGTYRHKDGRFNWSALLWRQPQLIAAALMAAGKPVGPLRAVWCASVMTAGGKYVARPIVFFLLALACVPTGSLTLVLMNIAISAIYLAPSAEETDTDARRLGWLMVEGWDGHGLASRFAVWVFRKRVERDYPEGMRDVADRYYEKGHPFSVYFPIV